MTLLGRAHLAAVPDPDLSREPAGHALDRDDDIADLRAQRDAALGALAALSAQAWAAPAGGFQRAAQRRESEDHYAAMWWGRISTAHEQDDEVDYWRIVSCRQRRGEEQ